MMIMHPNLEPMATYEEIGEAIGMSGSAVRKIEQRALRKLKRALARKGLTFEDLIPTTEQFDRQEIES